MISLLIPLALSGFTHIWNPIGFPTFHVDEGHYMRRALQVLEGLGPQESKDTYDYGYDHPFFGQIFLAASLSLINYPDSLNPSVNIDSIEMLYLVPRVLMGILAVIDTFLVYKIAEARYDRRVGFISATLFAVMPLSRILRGILLDSIELPFILLSILFAVYYAKSESQKTNADSYDKKIFLVLLSGIFLGIAIFTKIPVFVLIPLLVFIVLEGRARSRKITGNSLKTLSSLLLPVILIPMIWPAYTLSIGEFGDWLDGVLYQTGRQGGRELAYSLMLVSQIDPLLISIGLAAVIFSIIKKEYFVILWTVPYLVFLYLIGWVVYFHWSILLPILCIASGILVDELRKRFANHKFFRFVPYGSIFAVAAFGLVSFTILATADLNETYNEVYLYVTKELEYTYQSENKDGDEYGTTLIGSHRTRALIWIPIYIFDHNVIFRDTDLPNNNFTEPLNTERFLIVADSDLLNRLTNIKQHEKYDLINRLYYNSSKTVATFIDAGSNRYNILSVRENHGFGPFVEVRANY